MVSSLTEASHVTEAHVLKSKTVTFKLWRETKGNSNGFRLFGESLGTP